MSQIVGVIEEADAGVVEAAGRARVLGEDLGDDGEAYFGGVEVERRQAPEGAPSAGDGLRPDTVLGGEEGDDGAEDRIRKVSYEIRFSAVILCPYPPPAASTGRALLLLGSRYRRLPHARVRNLGVLASL